VPGLLQAARAGTVVMANALGSAFLESPACRASCPASRERLLGAGPAAAGAAHLVVRRSRRLARRARAARRQARAQHLPARRPHLADACDRRRRAIDDDPDAWTVQGRLRFSRAPIWGGVHSWPRPAMVRVYAIADGGGRWHVLPGGMTRVAPARGRQRVDAARRLQPGHLGADRRPGGHLLDAAAAAAAWTTSRARRSPVSSRTGENLFWLGRYTERTEQLVRLARAVLLLIDADSDAPEPCCRRCPRWRCAAGWRRWGVPTLPVAAPVRARGARRAGRRAGPPASPSTCGAGARLAGAARAAVLRAVGPDPLDARRFAWRWKPPGRLAQLAQVLPALDRLALQLAAVTGAQTDRMTRDHGWRCSPWAACSSG
jgi:hypothetical protein